MIFFCCWPMEDFLYFLAIIILFIRILGVVVCLCEFFSERLRDIYVWLRDFFRFLYTAHTTTNTAFTHKRVFFLLVTISISHRPHSHTILAPSSLLSQYLWREMSMGLVWCSNSVDDGEAQTNYSYTSWMWLYNLEFNIRIRFDLFVWNGME